MNRNLQKGNLSGRRAMEAFLTGSRKLKMLFNILQIKLSPIAIVKNSRTKPTDDFWEEIISEIELAECIPTEAFDNILDFSHLEIIYFFDKVDSKDIVFSGRPRGNPDYPSVGIF